MSVQTLLLEFSTTGRLDGDEICNDVIISLERMLNSNFGYGPRKLKWLAQSYSGNTDPVSTFIYNGPRDSLVTIRVYNHKSLCTVTLEYYLVAGEKELLTHDECKELELTWGQGKNKQSQHLDESPKRERERSTTIPAIQRGTPFDIYFPTTDKRILEYDIDKMLYNATSRFQHIQIAHSKTYGNMLILDGDPNLADSDLIYTESIMRRGIEKYKNKEILILGGGDGGLLRELLKEDPKHVTMIEIDEMVINSCRKYLRAVCGDVMDQLDGVNYKIIIADCLPHLRKFREQRAQFDYIFDDLTTIPVNGNANEDKSVMELQTDVLKLSCALLKPNTGKLMAHGPGAPGLDSTKLFEEILHKSVGPSRKIKLNKQIAFVPSFMESWAFYQVEVEPSGRA